MCPLLLLSVHPIGLGGGEKTFSAVPGSLRVRSGIHRVPMLVSLLGVKRVLSLRSM